MCIYFFWIVLFFVIFVQVCELGDDGFVVIDFQVGDLVWYGVVVFVMYQQFGFYVVQCDWQCGISVELDDVKGGGWEFGQWWEICQC